MGAVLAGEASITLEDVIQQAGDGGLGTVDVPIADAFGIALSPDIIPTKFAHNYTVIDTFTRSGGKFGSALGNVALIDCHYAYNLVMTTYLSAFDRLME